jgi:hypothetical protein
MLRSELQKRIASRSGTASTNATEVGQANHHGPARRGSPAAHELGSLVDVMASMAHP